MEQQRLRLLGLLREYAFQRGEFRLKSGTASKYYLDVRRVAMLPEGAFLLGAVLLDGILDLPTASAIGGPATGAIPLVTGVLSQAYPCQIPLEGFWVREDTKDHGGRQIVEGCSVAGKKVILVEDVATSGLTLLKAVQTVREAKGEVVGLLAVVDRSKDFAQVCANHYDLPFTSLFAEKDFADLINH